MNNKKLEAWAERLLDTGKRNNLINFRDTSATVEIVFPDAEKFYDKCQSTSRFEIYDPKIEIEDDTNEVETEDGDLEEKEAGEEINYLSEKENYTRIHCKNVKVRTQILAYSSKTSSINAVDNLAKKAREYLEETGVNVAYMAFGFVEWKEKEKDEKFYRAPLLLFPINIKSESSESPVFVELTGDDVVVNPTFNHLLEAQYNAKLPEYDEDENLLTYLAKVKEVVAKMQWSVKAECRMGIFSFLKINMYHDLVDNEYRILQNPNVRLLVGESLDKSKLAKDSKDIKDLNEVLDLHTVVDADSSQIEAIKMAKAGKSFVLQGPPGTGKSQTITNIIAECLHDGKKVLFVSEKQAALKVVYNKLKNVGLEEFSLELHSHKSNKKEVIAELCATLNKEKSGVSSKALEEIKTKAKLQKQLDDYASALHEEIPGIKRSMYQLYNEYMSFKKSPDLDFLIDDIETRDDDYYKEAVETLRQYEEYTKTVGKDYRLNPWYGFNRDSATLSLNASLKEDMTGLLKLLDILKDDAKRLSDKYALNLDSFAKLKNLLETFRIVLDDKNLKVSALNSENIVVLYDSVTKIKDVITDIRSSREKLFKDYEEGILKLCGADIYNKLTKLYKGFFARLFNSEYKKIIKDFRLQSKQGKKLKYNEAVALASLLKAYEEKIGVFKEELKAIEKLVEGLDIDSDYDKLDRDVTILKEIFLDGFSIESIAISDEIFNARKKDFRYDLDSIDSNYQEANKLVESLDESFDITKVNLKTIKTEDLILKLNNCLNNMDMLDNWIRFNFVLRKLEEKDLIGYLNYTIDEGITISLVTSSYQRLFFKHWIDYMLYKNPVFAEFTRITQERTVEEFVKKDKLQFDISKAQIKAELSAKRPSLNMLARGSAVSVLLREGEKKRKQMSIRKLLEEIGDLILVLKPCFLMSPLSVSTFLSGSDIEFDTVIFDEASQIFPQDAIGAIYRGKQLIVVGDSKQMPPSNFFSSTLDVDLKDDDRSDVSDFESILDLSSSAFSQISLKWHYRSKYEQLIAFSNKNFYENSLVTFPSAKHDEEGIGVDFHYVENGLFNRSTHTNKEEAAYVVDLIFENIEKYPDRSLGVVAFSKAQQALIEKLLQKRRKEDISKDWFFKNTYSTREPFFIKNLETVQGDERDTIIFSIAYGKDANGKLLHNFGPLNRVGGERRLNVAVTRAKENVQLVASIHASDIDLSRTKAVGAKLLREYLDYAQNGSIALESNDMLNSSENKEFAFDNELRDFLIKKGYKIDIQVGSSSFKVGLAIKKEDNSDYLLAIESDGESYHNAKNTRDRDRLRQEILERMGWRFYRVWSTDWIRNNLVEKENLINAVEAALNNKEYKPLNYEDDIESQDDNIFEEELKKVSVNLKKYKDVDLIRIFSKSSTTNAEKVKEVIEKLGPISEELLLKQMCFLYGREKVTSTVRDLYKKDMANAADLGIENRDGFLYLKDMGKVEFKVPGNKREIKQIALEELAAGLHLLIEENVTVKKDGLFKALVNLLGYTSVGKANQDRLEEALKLVDDVELDGDVVMLKRN